MRTWWTTSRARRSSSLTAGDRPGHSACACDYWGVSSFVTQARSGRKRVNWEWKFAMASPPIPPQLDHLITRPFSFYPPIIGVEHNEWLFRKATWSEILVVNCKTSNEVWIPRRFLG